LLDRSCLNGTEATKIGAAPIMRVFFIPDTMKLLKYILAVVLLAASTVIAGAQVIHTNYVTITNFVTITITNVVSATNASVGTISMTAPTVPAPDKKQPTDWNNSVSAGLTLARGNT